MAYECQNFKSGQVLTAECLNRMEKGIEDACQGVKTVNGATPDENGNVEIPVFGGGKSPYQYAVEAGFVGTEEDFKELLLSDSIKQYGAVGNGVTDDTAAFQEALANERVVSVPGGTYVLSDTLVIRENCCLELSQDTILKFTQTSGNCIEMRGSAVLRGNHGILWAAYGLTGHVIDMDTLKDGTDHATSIPPYEKSSPMFKRQRFIHDVNIIKPMDYYGGIGVCKSADGTCNGTAIYMSATNVSNTSTDIPWMWAINISGVRIAGGFSYGIHAINYDSAAGSSGHYEDDGWNHDMRIEAVIEQCEIGVALENCNGAHLNVTIQPGTAQNNGAKYAKNGVYLKDSRFVDMMRSRVWDWHHARDDSEEYKHIALYGNCRGLLLDDYLVTEHPNVDIRSDIYTDTPSNFDTMVILQEPANKWFKSVDNKPYFYDGTANRSLRLKSDKITAEDTHFIHSASGQYVYTPRFTNLVPTSIDTDGSVYNGKGYRLNVGLNNGGGVNDTVTSNMVVGFMPIDGGYHTYRVAGKNISFDKYGCNIAFYDSNFTLLKLIAYDKIGTSIYWGKLTTEETTLLTWTTDANMTNIENAAYIRVSVAGQCPDLVVTVDEKVEYDAKWQGEPQRLDDSIKVKVENVIGLENGTGNGDAGGTVKTVNGTAPDENGNVEVATGAEKFEVTVTDNGDGTYTSSHIASQITKEIKAGKIVTCRMAPSTPNAAGDKVYHLVRPGNGGNAATIVFAYVEDDTVETIRIKAVSLTGPKVTVTKYTLSSGGGVSSWNDLTDKPFNSERVEVLPETTVEIDPELGAGAIPGEFTFVVGKEYTVKYNGVEYVTSCLEMKGALTLGNLSAIDESFPITAEPFCLAYGDMDDGTMALMVCALDGSASVTLSIAYDNVTPIPQKFVTEAFPYWIVVSRVNETNPPNGSFVYHTSATVAEVEAAITSGRDVKMRLDIYAGTASEPSYCATQSFAPLSGRFATTNIAKWHLRFGLTNAITGSGNALFAIPQDDGTYAISEEANLD